MDPKALRLSPEERALSELTREEWERVADAMVVWTGKGGLAWPQLDDSRVIARFGSETANELLPVLRKLYDEFYASDAYLNAANLSEMSVMASAQFREKYPLARPSAVDALAWCYTFDYK